MAEYVNYEVPRGPKLYKFGKYSFSTIEMKHLGFALLMTILTITVHQRGIEILYPKNLFALDTFLIFFAYIISIGLGFVLHELGHKLVAQYYGYISEFRADFNMLIFMFIFAVFSPIIFLAPGAVMIMGRVTKRQNGIISVAGPLVNLSLAAIFFILNFLLTPTGFLENLFTLGIFVNAFLGIFNMLPFWVLDGKKVLAWNKLAYFSVLAGLIFFLVMA